ncbi:hypothetical protein [Streptomyces roseoverticillatus]|uniref:hypothetical protein n=1 Tax=Streptomyces roseoverticillatus TaxID=66429 RepID=UPI0004BFBF79|nr:hypothetical protein [Streptomyces roseoverticillatus]
MTEDIRIPESIDVAGCTVPLKPGRLPDGRSKGTGGITTGLDFLKLAKWLQDRYNVPVPGEVSGLTFQRLDVTVIADKTQWELSFDVGVKFPLDDTPAQLVIEFKCKESGGKPVRQGQSRQFSAATRLIFKRSSAQRLEFRGTLIHSAEERTSISVAWSGKGLTPADIGQALGVPDLVKEFAGLAPSADGFSSQVKLLYTSKDNALALSATLAGATVTLASIPPVPA